MKNTLNKVLQSINAEPLESERVKQDESINIRTESQSDLNASSEPSSHLEGDLPNLVI